MRLTYHILDVFTARRFAGNPLAVVLDADHLDGKRMQMIAREFNLSETVFVLTPRDPINAARLRIFTPTAELPFAGHPTVGTAVLLAQLRAGDLLRTDDVHLVLEELVGPVACAVRQHEGPARARFVLPRLPAPAGKAPAAAEIATALGLDKEDVGFERFAPSVFSAGVPFVMVPLASLDAVARAKPQMPAFETVFAGAGAPKAFVFAPECADSGHDFHARMFAPGLGMTEDPATGSAVAAFAGALMAARLPPDGEHGFVVEQGYEMGRPSLITLGLTVERGQLQEATISGTAVTVAEGVIDL
jgi:trans-2,3-dihydro-3-hydroxyanthranilate isomerase